MHPTAGSVLAKNENLDVSPDWPSAEAFAKLRITRALQSSQPSRSGLT
jgi:hypothetical protein